MPEPPGPTPMGGVSGITWTPAAAQAPTPPPPACPWTRESFLEQWFHPRAVTLIML